MAAAVVVVVAALVAVAVVAGWRGWPRGWAVKVESGHHLHPAIPPSRHHRQYRGHRRHHRHHRTPVFVSALLNMRLGVGECCDVISTLDHWMLRLLDLDPSTLVYF